MFGLTGLIGRQGLTGVRGGGYGRVWFEQVFEYLVGRNCPTRGLFGHMPHRTKHLGFAAGVGVLWNSTKRARRPLRLPRPQPQRPGSVLEQSTWVEHVGRARGSRTWVEKTSTRIEKGSSR